MSEENPIARMQRRLRADTAKLLNYDINNLSAWQSVRLDRASTLRLQLDDISAAQLRGEVVDMPRFILASKELEAMLGGNPDASTAHDFSGAREELRQFFARRADPIRKRDERLAEAKAALPFRLMHLSLPIPLAASRSMMALSLLRRLSLQRPSAGVGPPSPRRRRSLHHRGSNPRPNCLSRWIGRTALRRRIVI
jgi:hypothetical protein